MADTAGRLRTGWWMRLGLPFLAGAGVALGQAPFDAFWLAVPALGLAIWLGVAAPSAVAAARIGWLAGAGLAAVALFWIVEPFLVDLARHGWMAPFALAAMAGGFGAFWGGAFWAGHRLGGQAPGARALAIAAGVAAADYLRSHLFGGFPWALTGYIWIETPVYQLAAFAGPHVVGLFTAVLAGLGALAVAHRRLVPGLVAVAVLAAAWLAGAERLAGAVEPAADRPVVRLIQPNARQRDKWKPEMIPVFFQRQLALTAEPGDVMPELVIWPEVAVPFLLNDAHAPLDRISAAAGTGKVVLGAQRTQDGRAYNSVAVLGRGGAVEAVFDKKHLVPFGEFLPGGALLTRFGLQALAARYGAFYSPGTGPRRLDLGAAGIAMPLICYEGIFPNEVQAAAAGVDWMLLLTNDAWFGNWSGPYQHLAQARARAIEMGMPMVRVANTGVSAVIDPNGRVLGAIGLNRHGRLDARLPAPLAPTLYRRYGDLAALALLAIALGCAAAVRLRNSN